ncbi:MAG: biopolymer transporter ExbD [Gammaproteobacteria bacterium RBG_16_57_12]|nr:MAG: biopolymer transporter ExbD [Gammaproteobacteria bacterium RBG_16_57_12]
MAFGGFSRGQGNQPLAEINMVPLIDVMLVLLIIFMVTAPLLTHAVKVDLPRAASAVVSPQPGSIELTLDAQGQAHWNGEPVSQEQWRARIAEAALTTPQPELRIRADGELAYRQVAQVMSDAARAGVTRIGFVTDPRPAP